MATLGLLRIDRCMVRRGPDDTEPEPYDPYWLTHSEDPDDWARYTDEPDQDG